MTTTQNLKNLALASFRLIETGDVEEAARIISPAFVNHEAEDDPGDTERRELGPEGFLATGTWLRNSFSNLRFQPQEIAVDGDTVIAASIMSGQHTGVFHGIEPTGRAFAQKQVHIFHTANGRIVAHRAVRDDLGLLLQLGWKPGRA
ncbi:ester cyclase [Humibacter antri]